MAIELFQGQYGFLSNFHRSTITVDGRDFPTVEHYFQSMKTVDFKAAERIRVARSPGEAKRMGRSVELRSDWESIKYPIMYRGVMLKFLQHTHLRTELMLTQDEHLIEGNDWGDTVWGCVWRNGQWVGQNLLGQILMETRDAIKRMYLVVPA
jgi:ribA/ribD-fused uncharacterized protein